MFQTYEVEEEGREKNALDPKPKGFWIFRVLWKSPSAWTTLVLIQSKDRIMPNQNNVLLSVTRI